MASRPAALRGHEAERSNQCGHEDRTKSQDGRVDDGIVDRSRSLPLHGTDRPELVLTRVKIANSEALIPDFETIEADLVAAGAG